MKDKYIPTYFRINGQVYEPEIVIVQVLNEATASDKYVFCHRHTDTDAVRSSYLRETPIAKSSEKEFYKYRAKYLQAQLNKVKTQLRRLGVSK